MSAPTDYAEFLAAKANLSDEHGFDPLWIPEFLFDFQRSLVEWGIRKGAHERQYARGLQTHHEPEGRGAVVAVAEQVVSDRFAIYNVREALKGRIAEQDMLFSEPEVVEETA